MKKIGFLFFIFLFFWVLAFSLSFSLMGLKLDLVPPSKKV